MVLLTGFMDLGRIYFCSHSNWRKTNWIWFLFQHYIALFFGNKTLNSLLWSLSSLISILSSSSFFHIACRSLGEGGAALSELRGKEHCWRWSKVVGGRSKVIVSPSCNPYGMGPGARKGTSSDCSSWKVIAGLSWDNVGDNTEGRQDWSGSAAVLSASLPVDLELKLVKLCIEQFAPLSNFLPLSLT